MDDVLRPKTVPLSAETILWFEFLLNANLLTEHLAKANASPTPIELISKFLSIAPEHQSNSADITTPDIESAMNRNEGLKMGRKQLALKILGLKVASHLKWNLQVLEKNLTLQKQVQLLSDLCTVTSGKMVNLPLSLVHECTLGPEGSTLAFNFALTQYHRWVLRAQVLREIPPRIFKQGFSHILATQEQANSFRDEMFISSLEPFTQTSIDFLNQMCDSDDKFIHLTFDSFVALNQSLPPDRLAQNFNVATRISKAELKAQIKFDLCRYYLHEKKNLLAKHSVIECRQNHELTKAEYAAKTGEPTDEFLFCTFTDIELRGCLMACGVISDESTRLLMRMNESIANDYKNMVDILKEDNVKMEIPLVNRRIVELDIEGTQSASESKIPLDLLPKVAALNTIRSILNDDDLFTNIDFIEKFRAQKGLSILIEMCVGHLDFLANSKLAGHFEKAKIKQYLHSVLVTLNEEPKAGDITALLKANIFTKDEIAEIARLKLAEADNDAQVIELPAIATLNDWKMNETRNSALEIGAVKRQIISCTTAPTVRKLLVKLAKVAAESNQTQQLEPWHINPSWMIPISIKTILMSLQRGFFQDFAYILIAKSKEMIARNEFKQAISLMNALITETLRPEFQNSQPIGKLGRLVDNEILLFQITQTLEQWPHKVLENAVMISKCKQCLMAAQNNDTASPRVDILDACAAMLLNMNESASLLTFEKRFPSSELYSAIASAIAEMDQQQKSNASKKVCRDAWELVLPMFISNSTAITPSNKRNAANNASGQSGNHQGAQNSTTLIVSSNLWPFLKKLRDVMPISIILSLLARLHNILDDESTMELNVEYMHLWPTSISNATAYSIEVVSETLKNLLKQSLKYHPHYVPWIRLKGDLEYRNENFEVAMACYVNAIMTGSEYCTLNLQRQIDDYIIRRMIKCSTNLGCSIQAAILCQFLEEIDYGLAFKTFTERSAFKAANEKSSHFFDAMDSYFNCIWDPTLLEFIVNLLNKKGEHKRKQQAIAILGQLELNANNNDEVKREAAAVRRTRFLRCLANQYIL